MKAAMIMSFEFASDYGGSGGRESQLQRFYSIVEHMPIFIRVSDRDGNVTYLNKIGRKWKGIPDR